MSGAHPSHMTSRPMAGPPTHIPVLLGDVVEVLAPKSGQHFIDGTFGAGGYARALLEEANCTVWGIDRDPQAVARAASLSEQYKDRLTVIEGRFSDMESLLAPYGIDRVDGIALDLGLSSLQLDEKGRGFSFSADGPLDMRMGAGGPTAADIVNSYESGSLAEILQRYGEERHARRIARAIVKAREAAPIERTAQLADIVDQAVPAKGRGRIHPATRTFQALRIYVNNELSELEAGLRASERMLAPGGRLAVVSFHSLEDRIVKTFLRERSGETGGVSRHRPQPAPGYAPTFELLFRGVRKPGEEEIRLNPRSRSARLRAARRTDAPARPAEAAA